MITLNVQAITFKTAEVIEENVRKLFFVVHILLQQLFAYKFLSFQVKQKLFHAELIIELKLYMVFSKP